MNFKLDENVGARLQQFLRSSDHKVETVRGQGLRGASDADVYRACCSEGYCLVTFDLDFADVTRFPPQACGGIVVIRVPKNPALSIT